MKYTIYRGADIVVADVEIQGSVTEKIMGEESASLTFSSYEKIEFHTGDKITIFGRDYFLSTEPVTEKVNSRLFNYTLVFFSLKYILSDIQLFFYDNDNELTIPDFDIMGNASTCLDVILANANRIDSGWTKGTVDETEVKLISFSSVNCLEAISKLADEFELEYWIDADKSIHFTERKPVSGYSFSYGQSQGLKNIKRNILEGGSLCTRLYVKGSSQNLPKNYRSGQKNLRIDVPYLEKNTSIYGVKEHTETFDIYPKYEGTVTAVSATDFNIFSDSNLDFDLNAYNEYGTTVLKAGVAAKIIFQTGQLAGYTIELLEAGGFNSATKTFYLNRVKDEADQVVPSELLRPAVGDKYIIVDIMMPESYVTAAEALLKTKAQEYLDKNSRERCQYTVAADPFYFEAQNVNITLGSTVHFVDSDFGLDDDIRVIGKKTNVQNRYAVELELSEETQVSSIVKSYYEQQKSQTTIINTIKYNAELARRNYLFGREFHDKVFDGEDYFNAEKIKPLSIETKMLSLGSRLQQFGLPGVSFKIENNNSLINTSGKIVHQTINPDAVREWNITANSLADISANFNYIFIKCQKEGTNASFVVSEVPIKVEADPDFYHFEVGYLSSIIDGYRKIKTTYGFAQLNPAELSIGRIADPSGNNSIELKEDGIEINAKVNFNSGSSGYENLSDKPDLSSFEETRDYVNTTLQTDLGDLKNRADGVIESWFYSHTPTLSNLPASNWVTTEERNAHIGDTFTNMQEFVDNATTPDAGKAWRFVKNETTGEFSWSLIANSDSTKALIEAGKAKDTADAKRRVFVSQPYPPYNIGDLWVQGNGGDIMRCKFERLSGSYVATDFEKASKYTDDTAVNNLQIGGRNYARNSNFKTTEFLQVIQAINTLQPENGNELRAIGGNAGYWYHSGFPSIPLTETITISFWAKNNAATQNSILPSLNGNGGFGGITLAPNQGWTKYEKTGVIGSVTAYNLTSILFENYNDGSFDISIKEFKVEKGNKATDWSPAPEDVDNAIALVQSEVDDVDARLGTLQGSYDTFSADGVFSIAEAKALEKYINSLNAEKADLSAKYTATNGDANLVDKAPLQTAWNNYDTSHGQLITSINNAISDGKSTPTEKADVDVKFADYKNKLASLSTAFENALKAIEQKRIDNVQIGGRNYFANSEIKSLVGYVNYFSTLSIVDNSLKVVGNSEYVGFYKQYTVPLDAQRDITISFLLKNNKSNVITVGGFPNGNDLVTFGTAPANSGWVKMTKTFKAKDFQIDQSNTYLIYIFSYGDTDFQIKNLKVEYGNKSTDWTPAPEDVDDRITAEAQKIITLENKTNFLGSTTIDGNVVATGTLLVGNEAGTNAGLTGTGDTNDGVYLWGGGTYQQMVQGLAKKEQRRNGVDIWRHPNGQIGFEIGIKNGRLIFNGYHSDGFKLFELDPNRGLIAVSYTQESWTQTPLRKLNYTSSTFNESTIASEISGFIVKETTMEYLSPPPYTAETEYVYLTTYTVTENYVGYDYDNGTNPANSSYESLKGMKANNGDRNNNIPDGWYMLDLGMIYQDSEFNNYPPATYTFTVFVYYYSGGKITDTRVVTITK